MKFPTHQNIEKARKNTLEHNVYQLQLQSPVKVGNFVLTNETQVIVDGQWRDKAIWSGDVYVYGPSAVKYLAKGKAYWRDALLTIAARQFKNGKLPACVNLDLGYRVLSHYMDDYGLLWILSANEYLELTGDSAFETVFLRVLKSAVKYYESRVVEGLYVAPFFDLHWNWTILRPSRTALTNCLFFQVVKVAEKWGVHVPLGKDYLKRKFNDVFWNSNKQAFVDPGTNVTFLDVNALSLVFDLAEDKYRKPIFQTLDFFDGPHGPVSYLGKPLAISNWHKDLVVPYAVYFWLKALILEGRAKKALEIMRRTLRVGVRIANNFGHNTLPEFWKKDGSLGAKPAASRHRFLRVSLCHSWSTFGDL